MGETAQGKPGGAAWRPWRPGAQAPSLPPIPHSSCRSSSHPPSPHLAHTLHCGLTRAVTQAPHTVHHDLPAASRAPRTSFPCPTPSWQRWAGLGCRGEAQAECQRSAAAARRPSPGARRPTRRPTASCQLPQPPPRAPSPIHAPCPPHPPRRRTAPAGRQARFDHPGGRRLDFAGGAGDAAQGGHRARALPQHRHPGVREPAGLWALGLWGGAAAGPGRAAAGRALRALAGARTCSSTLPRSTPV